MIEKIKSEWPIIKKAPFTIISVCTCLVIFGSSLFAWVYFYTISMKDAKIEMLESKIDQLSNESNGSQDNKGETPETAYVELLKQQDYIDALQNISEFRATLKKIRDDMNSSDFRITQNDLQELRERYEKKVRPYVIAFNMSEPGETEWHRYRLTWDNPVELAMKDFSFFHVNLSLEFLSRMIGRIEHLKAKNP